MYSEEYRLLSLKTILVAVIFLVMGGAFALILRSQSGLTNTGVPYVVSPVVYFEIMTDHVMSMVFGLAFDVVFGVSLYLVPLLTGTRIVKYPKLANAGLWISTAGILMMMLLGGPQNQYMFTFLNPLMPASNWFIGYDLMIAGEWLVMTSIIATSFN